MAGAEGRSGQPGCGLSARLRPHDQPEAEVGDRGVNRLSHACRRSVAAAVIGRAEMRATFGDLARDTLRGAARIEARFFRRAARIDRRAAWTIKLAVLLIPVGGPLPDVAGHVVKPVTVGWERADRSGIFEPVLHG